MLRLTSAHGTCIISLAAAFLASSFFKVTSASPVPDDGDSGLNTVAQVTTDLISDASLGNNNPTSLARARCDGLFPVGPVLSSWTTCAGTAVSKTLSDETLRTHHVLSNPKYTYESAPDGRRTMKAYFPLGSFGYQEPRGGFSFYAHGQPSVYFPDAKEVTFAYAVWFSEGFGFNKGGKLPGLHGGDNEEVALGCSGGRQDDNCFSIRLMWREGGKGEFYTYLPQDPANEVLCTIPPYSFCDPDWGHSVGRGAFTFTPGRWNKVAMRVRLNDPGSANGQIQLFVEGVSVIQAKGIVIRKSSTGRIRGIFGQTFFGGSTAAWASPRAQSIYFSDYSAALIQRI